MSIHQMQPRPAQRRLVLRRILAAGARGRIDDELEQELGICHQSLSARRRELVTMGLIEYRGARRRTRRKCYARVHVVTDREKALAYLDGRCYGGDA